MTVDEAIASFRVRWAHPPLDRRDVEERIALRLEGLDAAPEIRVIEMPPACRVFVRAGDIEADERPAREDGEGSAATGRWVSRYVHDVADVDAVLTWIEARIVEQALEHEERERKRLERERAKAQREAATAW